MVHMTTRQRPADVGAADARRLAGKAGAEVKVQRLTLGISQELAATRAGVSESAYARFERGDLDRPTLDRICRAARAVGLAPSLSLYPRGSPSVTPPNWPCSRNSRSCSDHRSGCAGGPLPIHGDLRAWDGRLSPDGIRTASIEGESKLYDAQALARGIGLKSRDDPGADDDPRREQTAHNRRVLAAHREALRGQFPLDGGAIARALRAGTVPAGSAGSSCYRRPIGLGCGTQRLYGWVTGDTHRLGPSSVRSGPSERTRGRVRPGGSVRSPSRRCRAARPRAPGWAVGVRRERRRPVQGDSPPARPAQVGPPAPGATPTIGPCRRRAG